MHRGQFLPDVMDLKRLHHENCPPLKVCMTLRNPRYPHGSCLACDDALYSCSQFSTAAPAEQGNMHHTYTSDPVHGSTACTQNWEAATKDQESFSNSGMPPEDRQDLLLIRLGARVSADETTPAGALRRLCGARKQNARGAPLAYAPYSYRCDAEHVPRWIAHCRSMVHSRRGRQTMDEREQNFVAMGYFALIVMRRWRKWARREVGLRHLVETLCVRDALRRWKEAVKLTALLALLQRLAVRGALQRWKRKLEKRAVFEAARDHHSRKLLSKVWKAWIFHHTTAASRHGHLRNGMDRWREWLRLWKMRASILRSLIARRAVASAVRHWRLLSSGANDRRTLLQAVVGRQIEVLRVRKCFLALAQNAFLASTLRQLITSFYLRTLRDGFEAWRQALLREKQKSQTLRPPDAAVTVMGRRRQPGNPRKLHCRCVYAVCRGQRCTCAPRSHLLRRVEELHRLVAQGLDGRQGGYRLLSHVVQQPAAPALSGAARLSGRNPPSLGSSSRGCDGPPGTQKATVRAREGRDKEPKEHVRPGPGKFYERGRDQGLPAAAGSAVRSAAATAAAATTSCHATEACFVQLGAHRTDSLDKQIGATNCVASAASGGLRSEGTRGLRTRPTPRARTKPRQRDMTHW